MNNNDLGALPTARAASPTDLSRFASSQSGIPIAEDDDPYLDYEEGDCWNCGGEGYVYGCGWDWQCETYDEGEGTCRCARRCYVCRPSKPDPALVAVLGEALAQETEA